MRKYLDNITNNKKVIIFIGIILFSLISVYVFYKIEQNEIIGEKQEELKVISNMKVHQIRDWCDERISDIVFISNDDLLAKHIKNIEIIEQNQFDKSHINSILSSIQKNHNYSNIYICDDKNKIVYSLDTGLKQINDVTNDSILITKNTDTIYFSDFYFNNNKKLIDIKSCIYSARYDINYKIVITIDPSDYLFPTIESWPLITKSGESILVQRYKDSVLFLSNLHFKYNIRERKLPVSKIEIPAVMAVMGISGNVEGEDYRGEKVIAYIEEIPNSPWYIITKIDKNEIYTEIYNRLLIFLLIYIPLLFSLFLIWVVIVKNHKNKFLNELLIKEKELSSTNSFYKTVLYSIGDAVITTDKDGNVRQMNRIAEELTGWSELDALSLPLETVFSIVSEVTGEKIDNPVEKVISGNKTIASGNHTILLSKDGKKYPITDSGAPIRDETNVITGVVLVFRNQTDEKAAQRSIRDSEAFVRAVLDNLPIGIAVNSDDPNVIFNYINDNFYKFYRTTKGELEEPGSFWTAVYEDPEYREYIKKRITDDCASGDTERMFWNDVPITRKGFDTTYISARNIPIPEKHLMISIVWDVTEQRKLLEQILESKLMLKRVINLLPQRVFWKDINLNYLGCNELFASDAGKSNPDELIGKDDFQMGWKNEAELYRLDDRNTIDNGISKLNYEEEQTTPSGNKIWLKTCKIPLTGLDGNVIGILGTYEDITDKKLTELALVESEGRYRGLFENMLEGYAFCKMIYEKDKFFDFTFIDVNNKFSELTGLMNVTGKKVSEVIPGIQTSDYQIIELFSRVSSTGIPERFETYLNTLNIWISLSVYSPEKDHFVSIFDVITDRKKAEQLLMESEEKFRLLAETTTDVIWISDVNTQSLIYISPSVETLWGYTVNDALNNNFMVSVAPKSMESVQNKLHERLKLFMDGINENYLDEIEHYRKDGSTFWGETNTRFHFNQKSGHIEIYGITRDITERKRNLILKQIQYLIADAIVKSENLNILFKKVEPELNLIIDSRNFFIALYDDKNGLLTVPYSKDEKDEIPDSWKIDNTITGLVVKEKRTLIYKKEEINNLVSQGIIKINGSIPEIWVGVPLIHNETVMGVIVIQNYESYSCYSHNTFEILDIIAKQLSIYIDSIQKEENIKKLLIAIEQSPVSILITDISGTIEYVNPKFCELTGYSFNEIIGQNPSILKSGKQSKEFYMQLWDTLSSGKEFICEMLNKKKNGELFWESAVIGPVFNNNGEISHFIATKEDITEKKRLEDELFLSQKLESVGRLAAGIAHEINTPLQYIANNLDYLNSSFNFLSNYLSIVQNLIGDKNTEKDNAFPSPVKDIDLKTFIDDNTKEIEYHFKEITSSIIGTINGVERVNKIISALRNFSHPGGSIKSTTNLNELIDNTIIISTNEWKYIANIETVLEEDLPLITCSIDEINQVLLNLIVNAAQAIESKFKNGDEKGKIIVKTFLVDNKINIQIIDNGSGIKSEHMNKIFEPFFTTKEVGRGTGQGLAISRDIIVNKHHGSIFVESEYGVGTTFTIQFSLKS